MKFISDLLHPPKTFRFDEYKTVDELQIPQDVYDKILSTVDASVSKSRCSQGVVIVEKILKSLKEQLNTREVQDIRIGLGYTGVLLDDNRFGVAHTIEAESWECCSVLDRAGALEGPAWPLAKLSMSPRGLEASLGVATLNAILNRDISGNEGDILEFLELKGAEKIALIGNIRPISRKLRQDGHEVMIFERSPQTRETYPDWAVESLLPQADIVIITGSAIINKTIDRLLNLAKDAMRIALVGPSTPLAVNIFQENGVSLLGGSIIKNPESALRIISQGGGTKELKKVSRKVTIDLMS